MAEKPSGQCDYCGHIRYTNDLFNGECVHCVTWAEDQINALTGEVARLQAELAKPEPMVPLRLVEEIETTVRNYSKGLCKRDRELIMAAIRAAREGAR